ncbi:hypothetical protein F5876DRAFT_70163 [Lentinula aff. lateritia]|uniref:Uncharacterized protein n=1 Tax=Lentinula aff. lateritia TaxID=2804960 RepID=A0ACC1TKH5_9AGAR|nr:hypothetical protein F5876DRAFT_70163 [Lentinula aff. lateritia]
MKENNWSNQNPHCVGIKIRFEAPASQAVAGMAQCATCDMAYPTLFLTIVSHLQLSPPLTESLETQIGTEFNQPLVSQAVAESLGIKICVVPPASQAVTESLGIKIRFEAPASQAVAGMAQCATCDMAYPTLFLTIVKVLELVEHLGSSRRFKGGWLEINTQWRELKLSRRFGNGKGGGTVLGRYRDCEYILP